MEELEKYFQELLNQNHSIDIAEAEFKKAIAEDHDLHRLYSEWCHEVGSSERNGFRDFCEEYCNSLNEVWENLTDYDE